MKRIVDLTGETANGLWGYHELPGLERIVPRVEVSTIATVERDGFFASRLVLTTISGTYLEAGSHILADRNTLDRYGPEDFIRPAKVVKLPEQPEKALIERPLLERFAPAVEKGDALVIGTGWGRMWNRPGYVLRCPNMGRSAIEWVLEHEPSILGVDIPCIESAWSEESESEKGGLLGALFARDALLAAPLVNIESVRGASGTLICLPLRIAGVSGAPARVVFVEEP